MPASKHSRQKPSRSSPGPGSRCPLGPVAFSSFSFLVPLSVFSLVSPALSPLTFPFPFFFFLPLTLLPSLPLAHSVPRSSVLLRPSCVSPPQSLSLSSLSFFSCSAKARREFTQRRYPVAPQKLGGLLNKRTWSPTLRVPGFPLFRKQAESNARASARLTLSAFWPG